MRLKCIKLAGFKSFVDPTTVQFPSNMCAIVGPNGCGKSNVIDAVRWVMGESSAKNLRGESMADVIFNGSVNRQPVGQASIELVFDNNDGRVGGEYASYAEISTRRQVTREGQSEYFLNGTKCRRRDITDIFLGTGLGPRSYAIIEQGMISRLIESKPEELRVFIEEAAGISKYKERRKETESRMRRTLENLERLTDLREELERQLQHLKRQARAAEKYAEFKAEERELKSQLLALQWQALDGKLTEAARDIGELEVKLESVHSEHQQVDTAIEQYRLEHTERNDAFNKVQGTYYSLGAEVARVEQTLKHTQERGRQLTADLEQTSTGLSEAESHLGIDREKLASWETELAEIAPELTQLQGAEMSSSVALTRAEEAMHGWQQQWDEFNQSAAQPQKQAEVQQSRIQHVEQVLTRLQERIRQLQEEKAGLAQGPEDNETAALGEQLAAVERAMTGQEERGTALLGQIATTRDRGAALAGELNDVRSQVQQMRGRLASLEALQQAALEDSAEGLGNWMAAQGIAGRPRLVESMQVQDGWQLAVETVLGDYLQAVSVDDIASLSSRLGELEEGQLLLVESGASAPASPDALAAKVQSNGRADALLAGVRAADTLQAALQLRNGLAPHESVVTRDGVWLGRNWLRVARLTDGESGVIQRREELAALGEELARAQAREAELATAERDAAEALKALEQQRQQNQGELQASTREHADISARLSAHQAKIEQITMRRERIEREVKDAREQFENETQAIGTARQLLAESIESMESDSKQRETLLSSRDAIRSTLDTARQAARHDKDSAHQLAMRHQSLETQVGAMRDSIERTDKQVAQLGERKEQLIAAVAENDSPLAGLQEELEQQLALRLESENELTAARQLVAEVEHQLREAEQQRAQIEQRAETVRSQLEQKRLGSQSLKVQSETIQNQLAEHEQSVEAVLEALPEEANEEEWQQQLERMANRIARLGPINLAAIDEYELQSERKTYLDAQNEDLTTALDTLQSAIRKIDKETRTRFRETFELVNSGLAEIFPRVFGGGSAYLEMTGEDLLDTGITIMARPPGKKNATIHLLSGGEKALTAIALVFSIFQLNPAPFCILDEVDAPLDDANTGRYARLVKEMSDKVQFIF
ncbi:MAG: chromosome segregation protein SMC, partial [Halioglobus sp.]|nr:chromosome segregation protein SMC [Halioglobus sp.]